VLFEETTNTLLGGDLFTQVGGGPALISGDIVGPALAAEGMFHATSMTPGTGAMLRALADLRPTTIAVMHGPSFAGDGRQALGDLATGYEKMVAEG